MERLFTEPEWRAIAAIEHRQGYMYPLTHERRIIGTAFTNGEFYLAARPEYLLKKHWGPPRPLYWVYEKQSGLIVTWDSPSKAVALARARGLLSVISPEWQQHMLARQSEKQAEKEAREAISLARYAKTRQPKVKPIGRRRKAIFEAADGRCHYCATALVLAGDWHVDHKMPRALGGSNAQVNLVAACTRCNHAKNDKTDIEFKALLAAIKEGA